MWTNHRTGIILAGATKSAFEASKLLFAIFERDQEAVNSMQANRRDARDDCRLPCETIEPQRLCFAAGLFLAAFGQFLPAGLPGRVAADLRRRCAPRKMLRWTICSPPRPRMARRCLRAQLSRAPDLDVNREARELDPQICSDPAPPIAKHPLAARRRRPRRRSRAWCPRASRFMRTKLRLPKVWRGSKAHYRPYHAMLERLMERAIAELRRRRADRLPFHAVAHADRRRAPPLRADRCRYRHRRPLWRELRRRLRPSRPRAADRHGLPRRPQQALCRRLHHRTLRNRAQHATRCRSRSTARFTWMKKPSSRMPAFAAVKADMDEADRRNRAAARAFSRPRTGANGCGIIRLAHKKNRQLMRQRSKSREETPKRALAAQALRTHRKMMPNAAQKARRPTTH